MEKETIKDPLELDNREVASNVITTFNAQPIKPVFHKNEKENRDLELWNAITMAAHLCGLSGEDVTAMGIKTLKQLRRYDLLPPCERK